MIPTFALTLDTELIWGTFDHMSERDFERLYPDIRGTIDSVLRLLDQYEVAATWAVVGHLFLGGCERDGSLLAHPEIAARPSQTWRPGDWYAQDPCTDRRRDPLWYGDDILDALQAARTAQEIGCHSFSHALYGDPAMTREMVDADLDACIALAAARGIELRSFVFPRNDEGFHEALQAHGFRAYRGAEPTRRAAMRGPLGRPIRLAADVAALPPPVSQPQERLPGLWNIPASALILPRTGVRRVIPSESRIRKAKAGLRRARETGGVFHLWTHPFNLASDGGSLLAPLEVVIRQAVQARDRGQLVIEPMGAIAERMSRMAPGGEARSFDPGRVAPSIQRGRGPRDDAPT